MSRLWARLPASESSGFAVKLPFAGFFLPFTLLCKRLQTYETENDYSVSVKDGRVHIRPLEEREVMDYRKSAQEVLDNIGGADNVVSAAHCATRLRLVIADNSKVNKEALENIDGAKGVFEAQGQLQIIFGTGTVNKVYDEFIALSGVEAATKAEVKEAAAQQQNIFMRAIKVLGDVFSPSSLPSWLRACCWAL